jgi:hypothetical protein
MQMVMQLEKRKGRKTATRIALSRKISSYPGSPEVSPQSFSLLLCGDNGVLQYCLEKGESG